MPDNLNDYNKLAPAYQLSDIKPDKLFSTLPTVLKIAGNLQDKTVLDLGCGDGFFADAFACQGAGQVIGIDNSEEQVRLAKQRQTPNGQYILSDIFADDLPRADIILAPYVIGYVKDTGQLATFFQKIYGALNPEGMLITVVDLPEGKDLKKFGAVKTLAEKVDGAEMEIKLYNNNEFICALHARYYTAQTLETSLKTAGFNQVDWHTPLVSPEGAGKLGAEFWQGYTASPELGYLSATKT